MQPAAPEPALTERQKHAHGHEVGIALRLCAFRPAEGAHTSELVMNEISSNLVVNPCPTLGGNDAAVELT